MYLRFVEHTVDNFHLPINRLQNEQSALAVNFTLKYIDPLNYSWDYRKHELNMTII